MGQEEKQSLDLLRAWNSYASKSLPYLSQLVYDRNMVVVHAELGPDHPDGPTPERLVGRNLSEVLPPTTWSRVNPDLQAALNGESRSFEIPELDGSPRLLVDTTPLIEQGRIVGGVFLTQDAAMRITSDQHLHDLTSSFETAFNAAPIGMAMVGIDGSVIRVNQAFCQLTGFTEAELDRMKFQDLIQPDEFEEDLKLTLRLYSGELDSYTRRKNLISRSGDLVSTLLAASVVRNEEGAPVHLIAQLQDISELRRIETELRRVAGEDELTGLANRRQLVATIENQIDRCRRYDEKAALLAMDLDNFKLVNDRYGHSVGDELLRFIADELKQRFRSSDLVSRPGGDEFAVLVVGSDADRAAEIAGEMMDHFDSIRFEPEDRALECRASIGSATLDGETGSVDEILSRADESMYEVKSHRRSRA